MNIWIGRVLLVAAIVFALGVARYYVVGAQPATQEFTATLSASQVSTSQNFGFAASNVYIRNLDGTNEVFVTIQDATATTSHLRLNAGQAVELALVGQSRARLISVVCSSGETASVAVGAW